MKPITYKDAGVDVEKGAEFTDSIYRLMRRTFDGRVIENRGGFAGLFSVDFDKKLWRRRYRRPILVASTDGVGTKLKVAFLTGRHDTIGIDLVGMCVNDILVQGAEPLFFLDYLASGRLDQDVSMQVLKGISDGCLEAGCDLLGGETAEMPGFYADGEYDVAGFTVGVVARHKLVDGSKIEVGDSVIGLPSSGLHSNGYSLVRKVIFEHAGLTVDDSLAEHGIDRTVGEELLEPTRIYVKAVRETMRAYKVKQVMVGMAHITGGGLVENVPRILPPGCAVELKLDSWERPRVFDVVQKLGSVPDEDMYRTFNMGIGLVIVVSPYYEQAVMKRLERAGEKPALIGRVVKGNGEVQFV